MNSKEWLTIDEARKRVAYSPETGRLTWKLCRDSSKIGKEAKSLDVGGYVQVNICGTIVKGHRLAWFLYFGVWPNGQIDHINGDRADNRIENLRCVSNQLNCQNQRNGVRANKTGLLGVHVNHNAHPLRRYRAKIQINGAQIHLGGHPTAEEAHAAYVSAKRKLHAGGVL